MDNGIKQCYPNVMTATYDEVVAAFSGTDALQNLSNDTLCVVSLRNIPYIGRTEFSDVIIVYDPETSKPQIVAERIYRKYYKSDADYKGACNNVLKYMRAFAQDEYGFTFKDPEDAQDEYGFSFKKAMTNSYFEFVRFKAEVWQCVKLQES